ncbi:MAG: PHP domain-containing protein [Tissierellia bacterium]|nr:PHP domain-containing protein [Tissierellia bacterium]
MQNVRLGNKMKFYYDLHIHSDLSPCGLSDMTPCNIVNMSLIKGLNIISITDHNSAGNLPAAMEISRKAGIKVIPGLEVTTKEEVHVLCYFNKLSNAIEFGSIIYDSLPFIKNNPEIFGEQNIYNSKDEITGTLEKLLINASKYTIEDIYSIVKKYNGVMIPAHINKMTNGILGVLGFMPINLKIELVEVYSKIPINNKLTEKYKVLHNSDAHQLIDISEAVNYFELNDINDIYDYLCIY